MRDIDPFATTPPDPSTGFVARVIDWSVRNTLLVSIFAVLILAGGILSLQRMPLDAIPDLSDTQVIVRTDFAGQAPQIIENLVTYPLSSAMLGLPHAKTVRGYSMFGASFVYIIFREGTDLYWARSRVLEALSKIQPSLPSAARVEIGPDATGVGWIYQYALIDSSGRQDLAQLRTLQDWFLKFELATVPGVSEVASIGGFVKEYQVLADPVKLRAYGIALADVIMALKQSSHESGGRVITQGETEYIVRAKGYVSGLEDLGKISLRAANGTPVLLSAVARIIEGPELRRGVAELNGTGEAVGGIVIMRPGSNALSVIRALREKIESLKPGLPAGVEIVPVYDRAPLIEGAVAYLSRKLLEEAAVVALVCLVFLLHARSALVAIVTLPLGVLAAFVIMSWQGITANIMSLGGIAIAVGAMVDASIVMVENCHRRLVMLGGGASSAARREALLTAMKEVGPGLFFSLLIITVSFLPVFALTGQSGRLFAPLAYTKTYSMAFAALLSVTLVPVLVLWFVRGKIRAEEENPLNRLFIFLYKPVLSAALKHKALTMLAAGALMTSAVYPAMHTGNEFMPALYEGGLLYMPTTLPGISVTKAKEILAVTNRAIKAVPEVDTVFGKAGQAETATDPAPVSMIETWIQLKPKEQWRPGLTMEKLTAELDAATKMPGLVNSWGYPIKTRMDMVTTGIRTPVGIKVSGGDIEEIGKISAAVEKVVRDIPGTRSAFADRVIGAKYLEIVPRRDDLVRYNITVGAMQEVIASALGGMRLAESVEGRERYGIMLRYDRPFRESADDVRDILVSTPQGAQIPLAAVADIRIASGPPMIISENARLNGWVFVDITGRDIGSYVAAARKIVAEKITLPAGYAIGWSGQFEQMQEAREKLRIAIPAAFLIIFVLLVMHFGRLDRTLMVLLSIPFGLVGGVWAVYLAEYNFSVAVAVGFIALAGIAVETAVVMLIYLDQQIRQHPPTTKAELRADVISGAVLRVRPKLMTVTVIIAGLLPVFFTDGLGADVMRRIALPMVGGMITTTVLTLILIPVLFELYIGWGLRWAGRGQSRPEAGLVR